MAEIVIILALVLANGVLSGAEIAVVSLRRSKVQQLVAAGRPGASTLAELRASPERFFATVQIGITIVGTSAAAFGGGAVAARLSLLLARLPLVGGYATELSFAIVVATISYLSLVLGELVPKSIALRSADTYALVMARPLLALSFLARPIVWILTKSSNFVLRPFSDEANFLESRVSKEEIQQLVEEAAESGALHEDASEMASRALAFDRLLLRDVMIPRNRIDALSVRATVDRARRFFLEARRSRVPVYRGSSENVVGYLSAKDVLAIVWEGRPLVLEELVRPAKVYAETIPAIEVLRDMRREHQRLAIVVDEHGGFCGMVTFEDLVEEIVGEVTSEHEDHESPIALAGDGTFLVLGELPIREVNRETGFALEEPEGATTIAGLCTSLAGGIPNRGARLAANDGAILVVLDATPRAVRRVRLVLPTGSMESTRTSGTPPGGGAES